MATDQQQGKQFRRNTKSPTECKKRLTLEIDELVGDVNDFMWQWHGRPNWILQKLRFCPNRLVKDDLDAIKLILDKIPNADQLIHCRSLAITLDNSLENKQRKFLLDRAIANVARGKTFLNELSIRIQDRLLDYKYQSPMLDRVQSIRIVKCAKLTSQHTRNQTEQSGSLSASRSSPTLKLERNMSSCSNLLRSTSKLFGNACHLEDDDVPAGPAIAASPPAPPQLQLPAPQSLPPVPPPRPPSLPFPAIKMVPKPKSKPPPQPAPPPHVDKPYKLTSIRISKSKSTMANTSQYRHHLQPQPQQQQPQQTTAPVLTLIGTKNAKKGVAPVLPVMNNKTTTTAAGVNCSKNQTAAKIVPTTTNPAAGTAVLEPKSASSIETNGPTAVPASSDSKSKEKSNKTNNKTNNKINN